MSIIEDDEIKDDGLIHDIECWHCKNFFDCIGKPDGVASCINFEERTNINNGKKKNV